MEIKIIKAGNIPWNKGLTKETSEIVKRIGDKNSISLRGNVSKKRKYSRNPEDWKIKCDSCGNDIVYKDLYTYKNSILKKEKNNFIKCRSCSNKNRIVSEETRKKQSVSAKNRNINIENEKIRRKGVSIGLKKWHKNMTKKDKQEWINSLKKGCANMSKESKEKQYNLISLARKDEMRRLGQEDIFKPSYNKDSIEYIDNVLSDKYNCEFIHAESENGEFRIYDKEKRRSYYADAYSPDLNLWIEIDEKNHYSNNGNLSEKDVIRENRIKKILKCDFKRINFENIKQIN